MLKVYMHHIRKSGMCSGGAREFFQQNGLSWSEFLTDGIAIEKLEATKDVMALQVCATARKEQESKIKKEV